MIRHSSRPHRRLTKEQREALCKYNIALKNCPPSNPSLVVMKYVKETKNFAEADYFTNQQIKDLVTLSEIKAIIVELQALPSFDPDQVVNKRMKYFLLCFGGAFLSFFLMAIGGWIFYPLAIIGVILFIACFYTAFFLIITMGRAQDNAYQKREVDMRNLLIQKSQAYANRPGRISFNCGQAGAWLEIRIGDLPRNQPNYAMAAPMQPNFPIPMMSQPVANQNQGQGQYQQPPVYGQPQFPQINQPPNQFYANPGMNQISNPQQIQPKSFENGGMINPADVDFGNVQPRNDVGNQLNDV